MGQEPVDILLGSSSHAQIVLPKVIKGKINEHIATLTHLGWIISGDTAPPSNSLISAAVFHCATHEESTIYELLQSFWGQEEVTIKKRHLTPDDEESEQHFMLTHSRAKDYMVRLPVKKSVKIENMKPSNSFNIALQMLHRTESRFQQNENFKKAYCDFMQQYIDLGYMVLLDKQDDISN